MNTPAHVIFGSAAFARASRPAVTSAAVAGTILPDLSLYLLVFWSIVVRQIPPRVVFEQYYFSPEWQSIFAVDNSFVLWGLGLALALWLRRAWLIALLGSGVLHLGFDLPLHADDARPHFWPLSDWVFHSPISYWDPRHYGHIVGPIEGLVSVALCVILWRRFRGWPARAAIVFIGLLEVVPTVIIGPFLH